MSKKSPVVDLNEAGQTILCTGRLSWDSAFPDSSPFFPVELP